MSGSVSRVIRHAGDEERGRRLLAELQSNVIGPPKGPRRTEAEVRAELVAAIEAYWPAEDEAERTRAAVEKAEAYLVRCEADLAELAGVDQLIAQSRAEAKRQWAADGGEGSPVLMPMSDPKARAQAVEEIQDRKKAAAQALRGLREAAAKAEQKAVWSRRCADAAAMFVCH